MSKKCALGCRTHIILFRFPEDEPRRQQWFKAINMEYTITGKFLCGRHFSTRQFSNKHLRKFAVPDINLEAITESAKVKVEVDDSNAAAVEPNSGNILETNSTPQQCSILLLTNKQLKKYIGSGQQIKFVKEGETLRVLKSTQASSTTTTTTNKGQFKAPKATLEMMLTTREYQKMQALPKLPTIKNNISTTNVAPNSLQPASSAVKMQKPLLGSTDWKTQAEILRKNVEERLKAQNVANGDSIALQTSLPYNQIKLSPKTNLEISLNTGELVKMSPLPCKLPTNKNPASVATLTTLLTPVAVTKCNTPAQVSHKKVEDTLKESSQQLANIIASTPLRPNPSTQSTTILSPISKPLHFLNVDNYQADNLNTISKEAGEKALDNQFKENMQAEVIKRYKKRKIEDCAEEPSSLIAFNFKTVASQTASEEYQACGLIQRSTRIEKFVLSCFHCSVKFEISDWDQFTFHIENSHTYVVKSKAEKTKKDSKKCNRVLTPPSGNSFETVYMNAESSNQCDVEYQDDNNEKLLSPLSAEEQNQYGSKNAAIINFYDSDDAERILKFLETLRTRPILWHRRRCRSNFIDEQVKEFLSQFADDNSMTINDLHCSLENARKLLKRFTPMVETKKQQLENEPQLQEYVKLLDEIATLAKTFVYNCERCSSYFFDENQLYKHNFQKHQIGDITHICSCCGEYFAKIAEKEAHEIAHRTEPKQKCPYCQLLFYSDKQLQNHIILDHTDQMIITKPYQCTKCDEIFPKKQMLNWHLLKHEPPRYNCETCGKSYQKSFQYQSHLKRHLDQRDFICEECGKAYFSNSELKKHRAGVHKIGEHCCKYCKTFFASFGNLHMHMQRFHPNGSNLDHRKRQHAATIKRYYHRLKAARPCGLGRKPREFRCKQCGICFERMRGLRQHKRDYGHTLGDRRYKCPHCQSILNSKLCFLGHLRSMHQLPVKYSDIKYYTPLAAEENEIKLENEAIEKVEEDDNFDDVIAYEEVDEAVQNLNDSDDIVNVEYFEVFPKVET